MWGGLGSVASTSRPVRPVARPAWRYVGPGAPLLGGREVLVRASDSCQPPASPSPDGCSQDAAPASGRQAWNKGQPMPLATRRKLSQALKQRWKDPERKAAASAKLKGIEPWNKGRTLSEETRLKMRQAKLNRTASKATRAKMSASHTGKEHSQETVTLLSQLAAGRPKTPEHAAQIGVGQRRRHAAARVLRAVEAVYEAQGAPGSRAVPVTAQVTAAAAAIAPGSGASAAAPDGSGGTAPMAASLNSGSSSGNGSSGAGVDTAQSIQASRLAAYRTGGGGLPGGGASIAGGAAGGAARKARKMSKAQILSEYKAELREYRALQEELSPWSNAFLEKNGRKPGMQDVVATGIPWLVSRYKQYILLRDRLFTDTGTLRSRLDIAMPDLDPSTGSVASINRVEAGGAGQAGAGAGGRPSAAMRFSAAMEYKSLRGRSLSPQPTAAGQAGAAAAAAAAAGAPAAAQQAGFEQAAQQQQEQLAGEAEGGAVLGANVPPRVRLAMMAAQEYRAKKAQATAAAATAAAAAAKAGFAIPRPAPDAPAPAAAPGAARLEVGNAKAVARRRRGPSPASQQSTLEALLAPGPAAAGPQAGNGAAAAAAAGSTAGAAASTGAEAPAAAPAPAVQPRPAPPAPLPAEVVLTQAAAHLAAEEARLAGDTILRALQPEG